MDAVVGIGPGGHSLQVGDFLRECDEVAGGRIRNARGYMSRRSVTKEFRVNVMPGQN